MSKRLFVGNLPFQVDDASLLEAFQSKGYKVATCRVVLDRETGRSRGFAFVDIEDDAAAMAAIAAMNDVEVFGRPMRVTEAEDRRPPRPGGPGGPSGGPRHSGGGGGGGGPPRGDGPRPRPDFGSGPPRFGGGGGGGGSGRPMRKRGAGDDDYKRGPDREGGRKRRERDDDGPSRDFDPDADTD